MCADNFLYASAASGAKTTSYRILATLWPDLTPQAMLPPVGGPPPKKCGRPGPLARQVNVKCVYTTPPQPGNRAPFRFGYGHDAVCFTSHYRHGAGTGAQLTV